MKKLKRKNRKGGAAVRSTVLFGVKTCSFCGGTPHTLGECPACKGDEAAEREMKRLNAEVRRLNEALHEILLTAEEYNYVGSQRIVGQMQKRAIEALEPPNNKVSYHADNAGGAHGKDTNDK